jgi:hypothetical protein
MRYGAAYPVLGVSDQPSTNLVSAVLPCRTGRLATGSAEVSADRTVAPRAGCAARLGPGIDVLMRASIAGVGAGHHNDYHHTRLPGAVLCRR